MSRAEVLRNLAGVCQTDGVCRVCGNTIATEATPNAFFGRFHDRQVCALDPKEADAWMATRDSAEAVGLLRPPTVDEWEAVPVDDALFKHGRRELEHLVPIGDPIRA